MGCKISREQRVEGEFSPDRPALVFDCGWWTGRSFKEVYRFLIEQGYDPKKVYGYYFNGDTNPRSKGPERDKRVFNKEGFEII